MWFKSIWLHYWNLLLFQPWKWPSNDAASGISVSPLYNIWRPFSLLFPDSRTVSAGWETLFVATWVTVQINHALAGGIDLLRPLVHSLQGQRTSVLIYLHRLFTHVRHHKIPKGNPLIDLLTCFYYKVFLSIWDVVWIMPEYMRTYKNTYAPSPHSHLNFTEHQSLKKLCIWQIECAVILILLWGFYPSKFDSHYLCIPTGAVLVAQVWCANSFPSAEMPERVDEWFSGVDSACFHLVNMPLRGAL